MGKENPSTEKLICSSWSSIEQEYNDSSSQEDIEGNDQQRKSNCLKDVVASSDAFMHISIRNDGDDHNHSMQKKKCFIVSFKNSKYKRKQNTKIFSSKFMALASSMLTIYLAFEFASIGVFLLHFSPGVAADFSDNCPSDCNCKWANGKREADCTRGGFTTIPTNLDHEIQILRMTHNYVRKLEKNIFHSTGLINLQRIFMNHCHVQVYYCDNFIQTYQIFLCRFVKFKKLSSVFFNFRKYMRMHFEILRSWLSLIYQTITFHHLNQRRSLVVEDYKH